MIYRPNQSDLTDVICTNESRTVQQVLSSSQSITIDIFSDLRPKPNHNGSYHYHLSHVTILKYHADQVTITVNDNHSCWQRYSRYVPYIPYCITPIISTTESAATEWSSIPLPAAKKPPQQRAAPPASLAALPTTAPPPTTYHGGSACATLLSPVDS